jgi:hypothetical protein
LNFDGVTDVSATETFPFYDYELGATDTPLVRRHFSWQWIPVRESAIPARRNKNNPLFFDVDGDWKDEMFVRATRSTTDSSLISIAVTDPQGGDMDGSADGGTEEWWNIWRTRQLSLGLPDPGPYRQPGIQPESTVYSFTKDGTLLQNREGQLFSHDGQFIRNETRQDHLDIIERVLYLSNDTGRFCSVGGGGTPCSSGGGACQPTVWGQSDYAKSRGLRGMINPVERCGNCFSSANHKYTCMDSATSSGPTIFVRSRIRDRRRVRWVTRTAK